MRRRAVPIPIAFALLVALPARADEAPARPTTRIAYVREASAASCPDEAALRGEVAQRLGYDPFAVVATSRIRVVLSAGPQDGFRGVVSQEDAEGRTLGSRELQSASCGEVVSSIALTVVILLDPKTARASVAPAPAAPPPPSEPSKVAPVAAPSARPPASAPLGVRAGAGVIGALFVAPAANLGFYAFAGLSHGAFSVDAELRGDLPASTNGARTSLLVGVLAPCLHRGVFLACACASLGALQGEGLGAGEPRRDSSVYAALGPRLGIEVPLGSTLSGLARVEASFPLTPTTLRQGGIELWSSPPVGVAAGFGLVGRFR